MISDREILRRVLTMLMFHFAGANDKRVNELNELADVDDSPAPKPRRRHKRKPMSMATRKKIAVAAKNRWKAKKQREVK